MSEARGREPLFDTQSDTQMSLLLRAIPIVQQMAGRLPTADELRQITREYGLEFANVILLQAAAENPLHGPFARQVRSAASKTGSRELANKFEVTLVASNLSQSGRAWGDHVEEWRQWARGLGFKTDDIQTNPGFSVSENARLIKRHLIDHQSQNRIFVTYGQGTSELRLLFDKSLSNRDKQFPELSQIRGWINICGSFAGSAWCKKINENFLHALVSRLSLRLAGRNPSVLLETSSDFTLWRRSINVPANMLATSIVGISSLKQMPFHLRKSFSYLSTMGPNDGAVLALDAIAHPGLFFPVQGLTQKAESELLKPILERLLIATAQTMSDTVKESVRSGLELETDAHFKPRL